MSGRYGVCVPAMIVSPWTGPRAAPARGWFLAVPPPQAPAAPQPVSMNDRLSAGVLTQAEFEQQKARILNG
jgi:hypothetical protein